MSLARLRGANALLLALVGAALMARALVPAGWMPVGTAHGLTIELCSGRTPGGDAQQASAAQALLDAAMAGTADHKGKSDASEQPCAFAGLAHAAAPPTALPAPPAPVADAPEIPPFALVAAIGRGLTAPPPPATGPPLTA